MNVVEVIEKVVFAEPTISEVKKETTNVVKMVYTKELIDECLATID